jgi:hypothetical protein
LAENSHDAIFCQSYAYGILPWNSGVNAAYCY